MLPKLPISIYSMRNQEAFPKVFPKVLSLVVIAALLTLSAYTAAAAVYQYTDKSGKTHFSDQPFQYKQKTVTEENRNRRLRPGWIKSDEKLLIGKWRLFATSASKNGRMSRQRDIWTFNSDGSYQSTPSKLQSSNREKLSYLFNAGYVEIRYPNGRDTYSVIDLTKSKLVLRLDATDKYFYFERTNKDTLLPKSGSVYGRKQVAILVVMFACEDVSSETSNQLELDRLQKQVFLKTGIARFEKEKFIASATFYKKDDTFKEIYQPQISDDIKRCFKQRGKSSQ